MNKINNSILKYFLFILLLFFYGCVEHIFTIQIHPNGSYNVQYSAHGDKNDLLDHDFPIPNGNKWSTNSSMDYIEAESYDYTAKRLFSKNEKIPDNFYTGDSIYIESLIKHPTIIKHSNWFFFENYTFKSTFQGRKVKDKYPLIEKLLLHNEDTFPKGWLQEGLSYLLIETLRRSPVEWNTRPIIESSLREWINTDLKSVGDSTLYDEFDYFKNLGLDIIMQPATPNAYTIMDSIFKLLEDELRITMDLDGDDFDFQLILPGKLHSSNADIISGDTLFWKFTIVDYMNNDYIMEAKSTISYPIRTKGAILILFIFVIYYIKKKLFLKLSTKK